MYAGSKSPRRASPVTFYQLTGLSVQQLYIERYSKPHVIEKKKSARAASNASW
jgi:hypothetical protein